MAERFLRYYKPGAPDDCWPWQGTIHHAGYGVIGDEQRSQLRAHRVSYERANGPIPDGLNVLHRCDNPPCCNPAHLFLGTLDDNNKDKTAKGRTPHGSRHIRAKITEEDVLAIRALRQRCKGLRDFPQAAVAAQYGIALTTVKNIVNRRSWKHLR